MGLVGGEIVRLKSCPCLLWELDLRKRTDAPWQKNIFHKRPLYSQTSFAIQLKKLTAVFEVVGEWALEVEISGIHLMSCLIQSGLETIDLKMMR